jgi:hypothetical protein
MTATLALAAALAAGAVPAGAGTQDTTRAFLDPAARQLVERARAHRERVDRSITRYTTRATERISLGLSALRRERLFFRRETATSIDWQRDGVLRIHVDGARQVIPPVLRGVHVPHDVRDVTHHAFDPADDRLFLGMMDSSFVHHPLAAGSEARYRFRSGDTTAIRLQDGRSVRLIALDVIPRAKDVHLVTGTLWLDADSHATVRAVFRLADAFDFDRHADEDDRRDVPGFVKPIRAEVDYFTIEYGLWDLRWWLPRVIAFEGSAQVSFVRMPIRYERRYDAYVVEGDPDAPPIARSELAGIDPDSALAACYARGYCRCSSRGCRNVHVVVPDDTAALLSTPRLPPSIHASGDGLLTESEVRELDHVLRRGLPEPPWQLGPPSFAWGLGGAGLVRYNRVEALSVGARAGLDFGRLGAEATARLGVADLEPNGELALRRTLRPARLGLTAYRRLDLMDPGSRALGFGNSVNALVLGRDDGEYFRARGVELEIGPARAVAAGRWAVRLFAEAQRPAAQETDASLARLLDRSHAFRPNRPADRADQLGAALSLRHDRGLDPAGFRWGASLDALGATGTFDFARASLAARAATTAGPVAVGVELAAGSSVGDVPVQSRWYLGGAHSVRGYAGASADGTAFWRGRVELGGTRPGARLLLFSDLGWAGDRGAFPAEPSLVSAGAGWSFLDGVIRVDLARALRGPTGWRLEMYVDGVL